MKINGFVSTALNQQGSLSILDAADSFEAGFALNDLDFTLDWKDLSHPMDYKVSNYPISTMTRN